jgi:hypothetical protein
MIEIIKTRSYIYGIAVVLAVLVTYRLGAAIIYLQGNVAYGSTLIWASFAVYSKADSQAVQYTA